MTTQSSGGLVVDELEEDEIQTTMDSNHEATKITITLHSKRSMSTEDIVLELEYYISELARAEQQLKVVGDYRH